MRVFLLHLSVSCLRAQMTGKALFKLKYVCYCTCVGFNRIIRRRIYRPLLIWTEFMTSYGPLLATPHFYVIWKGVW